MKRLALILVSVFVASHFFHCDEKKKEIAQPWYNPDMDIETRLDSLITQMTLEEKVSQMMNDAPAIERLGVPKYNWWNECLHGVARSGLATVFPQAIGLAATWDKDLMFRVSTAISDEARAKHHRFVSQGKRGIYQGLTFWSPNINIFRDPRWGRGMETYGEDPYLTGQMAVQFVKGLQGDHPTYLKTVATVKHYAVHSGPEPARHTFNAQTSERDLRETYLPHFRTSIVDGNAYSVMCAYNRYDGEACCGSSRLLTDILRHEWDFDGYVVSDCGAIRDIYAHHNVVETSPKASALAVKSGTDLNCGRTYESLVKAVDEGFITEEEIDRAVYRLFRARMKLGMFDPDEDVPYAHISYEVVDSDEHKKLALETAQKSLVLLKNENNTLPLSTDISDLAVIGPNADDVEMLLGNYNGIPSNPITPLQGIRNKLEGKANVHYALGCEWAENLPVFDIIPSSALRTPEGEQGLKVEYFDNRDMKGEPVAVDVNENVDFNWWDGAPLDTLDDDNFGVRWTGKLVPPVDGWYALGAEGFNGFKLYLEGKQLVSFRNRHHSRKTYDSVVLKAGQEYDITLEFSEWSGDADIHLLWSVPGRDVHQQAMDAAGKSDAVVMFMGLSPRLEGEEMRVQVEGFEGGDRVTIDLPDIQKQLMKDIVALGKPTVLVLLNGSALAVNWADENIPAIVEAWYPGQAAGTALADVLFGDVNPGGRLPLTFYKSADQLPAFTEYDMKNQTYRYFSGEPLYAFGHGLSYTQFQYSDFVVPDSARAGELVEVKVTVKNTGKVAGEEVVQLYVSDKEATVPVPIRSLAGFQRIFLGPGESKDVSFTMTPRQLSLIDDTGNRIVEPGIFALSIGGKQPGTKAETTEVIQKDLKVTGETFMVREMQ